MVSSVGVTLNGVYIEIYAEEKPEHYTGSPSITIRVKPSEKDYVVKAIEETLEKGARDDEHTGSY